MSNTSDNASQAEALEHFEFRKLLQAAYEHSGSPKPKVDTHGHDCWYLEHEIDTFDDEILYIVTTKAMADSDQAKLLQAWQTKTPITDPIDFPRRYNHSCTYCENVEFTFDGYAIHAKQACEFSDGFVLQVTLNVPSGRLIVGNDFREALPAPDDFNVNEAIGIKRTIESYAEHGPMLHFFVGNSCPSVYPTGDDKFIIANAGLNADYSKGKPDQATGEKLATIGTDLWWVSICDGDDADAHGLEYGKELQSENVEIKVTPGEYVLTYYVLQKSFDRDDESTPTVFAKLELV